MHMREYWSQYWQQGHLTSFGNEMQGNYQGTLRHLWSEFFARCKPQQSILDICTGNGALLDIALKSNPNLVLVGVDYAQLTLPKNLSEAINVDILQNVNVENLPFIDNSFDNVTSQFGIEYANLALAFDQIKRVLKVGGTFKLVMHDVSSSIVKPNAQILSAAKSLTINGGVLFHLAQLFVELGNSNKQSTQTEACRMALNLEIGKIANNNETGLWGTNFPAFLKHVMSVPFSLSQRQEKMNMFFTELKGQIERLSDLVNAALSDSKYQDCLNLFNSLELTVTEDYLLQEDKMTIARVFHGHK